MNKALVILALATMGLSANAHQPCRVSFEVSSEEFAFQIPILSALLPTTAYELTGFADITCGNAAPVRAFMLVRSNRWLSLALGPAKLAGVAVGIGQVAGARGLLGEYHAVGAQAVLVGANLAVHAEGRNATLDLSLNAGLGIGQVGLLNIYLVEAVVPVTPRPPLPPTPRGN